MKKLIIAMLIFSVCMFAGCDSGGSSDTATTTPGTPPADNIIPEGAYYASYDGTSYTVYNPGDEFPAIHTEDIYLYGSYKYEYSSVLDGWSVKVGLSSDPKISAAFSSISLSLPSVASDITSVGVIEESVNGKEVKNMNSTFYECSALVSLPADFKIPASLTNMTYAFAYCEALVSLPAGFTIPSGVIGMDNAFYCCGSLATLSADFTIPDNATSLNSTFAGCSALTSFPVGFTIPSSVNYMNGTFSFCSKLASLPASFTIPESVTVMSGIFESCVNLTGTITIHADPTSYNECFYGAGVLGTGIELDGDSTMLATLAAEENSGDDNVTVAP